MTQRLTDETLAAIRQRAELCANHPPSLIEGSTYHLLARQDIPMLFAEVEALNEILHRISITTVSMGYVDIREMADDLRRMAREALK
jgi:hypothetical protein